MEDVRRRLERAVNCLEAAGIQYAVIGENAVAARVSRVDREAVRNTRDVGILLLREELEAAKAALEADGFIYRHVRVVDMFLDGPGSKARSAVHVPIRRRKSAQRRYGGCSNDGRNARGRGVPHRHARGLVRMKLTSYRDKDRTHLRDLIEVELIDETWTARYPGELGQRLQALLDDPDG